jgi:di/tricarboxylate transporter
MTFDQTLILLILAGAAALFVLGKPRYDVVALLALLACAILGLVPAGEVFDGFGHPAVITVASVLVISRALRNAGVVEIIANRLGAFTESTVGHIAALTLVCGFCSAFMNNVGALAILMPVALETAGKQGRSPALLLMPLSFGAILGGLATMIGTPPNVIIAQFRREATGEAFGMFDFSPIGATLAVVGIAYLIVVGWRLIPGERQGKRPPEEIFHIQEYMAEGRVTEKSDVLDRSIASIAGLEDNDVLITALVRGEERRPAPSRRTILREGDVLVLRADPTALESFIAAAGLELVGGEDLKAEALASDEIALVEAVVTSHSLLTGHSARTANLRQAHGVNLLAAARHGARIRERLERFIIQPGDVLLLQGDAGAMPDVLNHLGCLPLMHRGLRLGAGQKVLTALALFAVALAATAFGLLPAAVALLAAVAAMVLVQVVSLNDLYDAIDWPIIVLLGAMIPVGAALENTGAAELLALALTDLSGSLPLWVLLGLVLVVTMTLSDIMNNAATAVVMAPIAIGIAGAIGASSDAFLMAVAIGASSAFLTPIGHQCNTLVLGPGGYKFSDYWRVGLPLEIIIVVLAVPMIVWIWG